MADVRDPIRPGEKVIDHCENCGESLWDAVPYMFVDAVLCEDCGEARMAAEGMSWAGPDHAAEHGADHGRKGGEVCSEGETLPEWEKAYRAWRIASEKGYGERDHSISHMERVDARIRRLKAKYEALLERESGSKGGETTGEWTPTEASATLYLLQTNVRGVWENMHPYETWRAASDEYDDLMKKSHRHGRYRVVRYEQTGVVLGVGMAGSSGDTPESGRKGGSAGSPTDHEKMLNTLESRFATFPDYSVSCEHPGCLVARIPYVARNTTDEVWFGTVNGPWGADLQDTLGNVYGSFASTFAADTKDVESLWEWCLAVCLADTIIQAIGDMTEKQEIPWEVYSFAELHDHCDANMLGDTERYLAILGAVKGMEVINGAQALVSQWLSETTDDRSIADHA